MEATEMCAGRDDIDAVAKSTFGAISEDCEVEGPLYATGLEESEAHRNDRYWPTLGTYRL